MNSLTSRDIEDKEWVVILWLADCAVCRPDTGQGARGLAIDLKVAVAHGSHAFAIRDEDCLRPSRVRLERGP